ncbi:MAG: ketopantoate reductase family protein [Rhodospirillaceae bacterium]|jgi:2-dehydropantoate 2-reductase|nr:ketopantoate reductase family protein [Rhodospirillaceae bacterium]MBT5896568.1 ketopantoate reductase family protein [Rhodospirillaceae bacterium]MBT6429189.1 ketopantoate reductase family protein [Rhodospirillaceae bacterium]MBT7759358.1 ketopantoate reductase family protein [Rhodospirillaceae bacterium]
MRIIIYGAGGIGGVIGAQLFQGDVDVVLIARGDHLQAIQDNGLHYRTPHQDVTLPITAVGHPGEIDLRPNDVVILTMKSQHTEGALDDLRAAAGDQIPVFSCQNGVDNERMAARRFQNVYAMMVYLPATALEPGTVVTHAAAKIGVLDASVYPTGSDKVVEEVTAALESVNFSARPNPTVMRFKYGKLIMNLGNALAAVAPPGDGTKDIRALMRAEAEACFKAAGIDCARQDEEKARRGDLMKSGSVPGQDRVAGSSWQSLERGTGNIEADFLNGEIVMLGRLHGVPTPANAVLQRLANELAANRGEPQSISLAEVQRQIAAD